MNSESPFHQSPGGNPFQQQPPINPYAAPMTDRQSMGYAPSFGMDQEFVLASRWLRLAGVFIDTLIVALVCVPFLFLFVGTNAAHVDENEVVLAVLAPALLISCVQWYLTATSGQTIAKKLLGMKIVLADGSAPGFVHGVLLRSWVMSLIGAVPLVGPLAQLVDPLLIFGAEKRCLHDLIAGTRVISV